MSTETYTRPVTIEIPQMPPVGAPQHGARTAGASAGSGAAERLREATAAATRLPRSAMATAAGGLLLVIALTMPWFHLASLESGQAGTVSGFASSHLRGLVMLACGLVPVAAFGLRAAGVGLGGRLSGWTLVTACGFVALMLTVWAALTPPEVLSSSGIANGIAAELGAGGLVGGIASAVGEGATPASGLYLSLLASLGVCVGGQFLAGGPYAAATATTKAGATRRAVDALRARGDHFAIAPLFTAPAATVLALLGCVGHDGDLVGLGFLVAIATTVLAIGARGRLKDGSEELAPVARKQLGLAFTPLMLILIVVGFAVVSVSHTASLFTTL
jgi:hypothetical protein